MNSIEGTVAHILFTNDENAYAVAKIMSSEDNSIFTITGSLAGIQVGEYIICTGDWKNDKKFGLQFSVSDYQVHLPSDLQNIERFLSSGNIAGIGEIIAKRIVSKFGKNTFEIFESDIDRLQEVEGIGQKKLLRIKSSWNEKQNSRELILFFQNYAISPLLVNKIFKKYGQDSIQIVTQNPYLLVEDKIGIGFKKADEIAFKMGFSRLSKERISAGILFFLNDLIRKGNTCFPEIEFLATVEVNLAVEIDLISLYLEELISEKRIVKQFLEHQNFIWPALLYFEEKNIVRQLDRINSYPISSKKIDFVSLYSEIEEKDSFFLSANQKKAVENCFKNQIHIVTGGPGTGKSTIVNVLLKICEKHELSTVLTAPTGRASKRMTEITGKNANTIHSLLSIDFNSEKNYSRNKVKVEADFILVDELSMVDTFLMSCFLEAVQVGSRIVFIGDSDQLPSVGPGKVLKDFIESGKVKVSHLNEIFRQKNYSKIIQNAHLINSGKLPDVSIQKESDFFFIRESNPEKISDLIVDLLSNRLKKAYHFNPIHDIQVLCPVHKGMIGTIEINQKIQHTLNPQSEKKETYYFRNQRYTVGDKVIQNKNNYEKSVFNGDIGIVKKINLIDKLLYVKFEGEEVEYDFGELNEIDLAYALSVHKFQGSEVPCVIMPVHDSNQFMLSRNLLYTAVTRAKKLLILIGTENALQSAVQNLKGIERFSGLKFFLSDNHSDKFPEIKIVPMPGSIGYEEFIRQNNLIF